jgi:hypothetical protein
MRRASRAIPVNPLEAAPQLRFKASAVCARLHLRVDVQPSGRPYDMRKLLFFASRQGAFDV